MGRSRSEPAPRAAPAETLPRSAAVAVPASTLRRRRTLHACHLEIDIAVVAIHVDRIEAEGAHPSLNDRRPADQFQYASAAVLSLFTIITQSSPTLSQTPPLDDGATGCSTLECRLARSTRRSSVNTPWCTREQFKGDRQLVDAGHRNRRSPLMSNCAPDSTWIKATLTCPFDERTMRSKVFWRSARSGPEASSRTPQKRHKAPDEGESMPHPCKSQACGNHRPPRHTLRCARTIVRELANGPGQRASFVQHAEIAGHTACERKLLLHQKHGEPTLAVEFQEDIANLVHDIRLNAFGGLIQNQQLRFKNQRAPDCELLLLSAGQIAPRRPRICFNTGTNRTPAGNRARAVLRTLRPTRRFSSTVSCGNISAPGARTRCRAVRALPQAA